MKICTCKLNKTEIIDSGPIILGLGGALHLVLLLGLTFFVKYYVGLVYLVLLITIFTILRARSIREGHSTKCAARSSFLKLLDLGTFISF